MSATSLLVGEIINLRQARKARDRKAAEQAAAEARALHGRTKAQRKLEKAEAEKLTRAVDQSKLETRSDALDLDRAVAADPDGKAWDDRLKKVATQKPAPERAPLPKRKKPAPEMPE